MADVHKIGPVQGLDASVPDNVYGVRVSDLQSYADTPSEAVRVYAQEQGAIYVWAWSFNGEDFAFLQFPK